MKKLLVLLGVMFTLTACNDKEVIYTTKSSYYYTSSESLDESSSGYSSLESNGDNSSSDEINWGEIHF